MRERASLASTNFPMQAECKAERFDLIGRTPRSTRSFAGQAITSGAGALLLRATDRMRLIGLRLIGNYPPLPTSRAAIMVDNRGQLVLS